MGSAGFKAWPGRHTDGGGVGGALIWRLLGELGPKLVQIVDRIPSLHVGHRGASLLAGSGGGGAPSAPGGALSSAPCQQLLHVQSQQWRIVSPVPPTL